VISSYTIIIGAFRYHKATAEEALTMERDQFTFRAPKQLLDRVREEAVAYGDSMNDLVVAAVQREVSMRQQLRLLDQIVQERRTIQERGIQPDSTPMVRQIRAGSERHE
jgi:hypothetical protein